MKSPGFTKLLVSALLIGATLPAGACGPYEPIIPTPEFFKLSRPVKTMTDYEKTENLLSWQALTSPRIPLADIEQAVYKDDSQHFYEFTCYKPERTKNLFYTFLVNKGDEEIINFLSTAKTLEECWAETRSPWYYPSEPDGYNIPLQFSFIIKDCRAYTGKRLKDRYALQLTRALFATRQYPQCIVYVDSAFADIPDANLMKRMARRYQAGCWSRLGDVQLADTIFARSGDVWSIAGHDPAALMAALNPRAPQLMEYLRENAADTAMMRRMVPAADALLASGRVADTGDWNFLLAYVNNEYNGESARARRQIYRAMEGRFSSPEMHDLARAYKMKLDAQAGDNSALLNDLKWMESLTDVFNPDAKEWLRRVRNIIYVDWVPRLWKKKDYATALMLCAYADNRAATAGLGYDWSAGAYPRHDDKVNYCSLSFQMMASLTSTQLEAAYRKMTASTPLFNFLRRDVATESDYYNELIGTLALREENYARAERYLSRVSKKYIAGMPVYSYLHIDPFRAFTKPREGMTPYYKYVDVEPASLAVSASERQANPKLDFASKMRYYQQMMKTGRTADERGLARLMYAIGRRNAYWNCWALTQYWNGWVGLFDPCLQYWESDFRDANYNFLADYQQTEPESGSADDSEQAAIAANYNKEVQAALGMLTTDEARAKAQYILGHRGTVIKKYPATATASYVKTHCDNWKNWL